MVCGWEIKLDAKLSLYILTELIIKMIKKIFDIQRCWLFRPVKKKISENVPHCPENSKRPEYYCSEYCDILNVFLTFSGRTNIPGRFQWQLLDVFFIGSRMTIIHFQLWGWAVCTPGKLVIYKCFTYLLL